MLILLPLFSRKGLTIFSNRQASKIPLHIFAVAFNGLEKPAPYVTHFRQKYYAVTGKSVGNLPLILEVNDWVIGGR